MLTLDFHTLKKSSEVTATSLHCYIIRTALSLSCSSGWMQNFSNYIHSLVQDAPKAEQLFVLIELVIIFNVLINERQLDQNKAHVHGFLLSTRCSDWLTADWPSGKHHDADSRCWISAGPHWFLIQSLGGLQSVYPALTVQTAWGKGKNTQHCFHLMDYKNSSTLCQLWQRLAEMF